MTSLTRSRHRPFGRSAERFSDRLRAYPRLAPDEIEEMIAIYPKLTILELGLLSADDVLAAPLDQFVREHRGRLKQSWHHHFLFAFVLLATMALFAALVGMAVA